MTFARQKRLLVGWLALLAPVPLAFNDILEWPHLVAYLLVVALFLRRAARDPGGWLPTWAMNVLAVAYLPYFAVDLAVLSRGRLVAPVTHLLLFTVLVKLFAMRRERDKWQTAIAVFFLFVTSMATSVHPSVVLFLVVFLLLSLLLFARFAQLHLMAGFAATEEDQRALLAVPVRRFLLAATGATLLFAIPLFVLLPRVRSPFVGGHGQGLGTLGATTGFADEVTLDTIGRIRTSREVAMRLRYEDGVPPGHEMRYKGGAFELYQGGVWKRHGDQPFYPRQIRRLADRVQLVPGRPERWVDVYLRPVTQGRLLVPVEGVTIEGDVSGLALDDAGVLHRFGFRGEPEQYRVGMARRPVSKALPLDLSERDSDLARPYAVADAEGRRRALLDTSGVSPRVAALAAREAGDGSPYRQARNLERYLMENYQYSLDFLGKAGRDPIEAFLFDRRKGHCEYFASSMVLMLRSVGIPARLATGYLGADYNRLEGYYVVRESNAHAWVEAYLPGSGWTTFDPTPAAGRPAVADAGASAVFSEAWDYMLFRWDRYVLTYGLADQVQVLYVARGLWEQLVALFRGHDPESSASAGPAPDAPGVAPTPQEAARSWGWWLAVMTVAALALAGLALALYRRRRRPLTGIDAYRRLRRSAERAGLAIGSADPPLGFGETFGRRFPDAAGAGSDVVRLYVEESFAERELGELERDRLGEALSEALTVLRKAG